MKKESPQRLAISIVLSAAMALSGCGVTKAKDFGGHWKPVNRFHDRPVQIPLSPSYTYYASPMDETLKSMLTRWATDSGRTLDYQLDFDVTLYGPVADIHTTDIHVAVDQLNGLYAAEAVSVSATNSRIEVTRGAASSAKTVIRTAPQADGK